MTATATTPIDRLLLVDRYTPAVADAWRNPDGSIYLHVETEKLAGPAGSLATLAPLAALRTTFDWDAHTTQYRVTEIPGSRVKIASLPALERLGASVELHWLLVDIDNPGHVAWSDLPRDEARARYQGLCRRLDGLPRATNGEIPSPIRWRTKAGMRAAWPLAAPVVPELDAPRAATAAERWNWGRAYTAHLARLEAATGIVADPTADWTRLFRLPGARRRGDPSDPTQRPDGDLHVPGDPGDLSTLGHLGHLATLDLKIPPPPLGTTAEEVAEAQRRRLERALVVADALGVGALGTGESLGELLVDELGAPLEDLRSVPEARGGPRDPAEIAERASEALKRAAAELAATPPGARNETTNAIAYKIGRRLHEGIPHDEAFQALFDAAAAAGLPGDEAERTIRRALTDGSRNPRAADRLSAYVLPQPSVTSRCPEFAVIARPLDVSHKENQQTEDNDRELGTSEPQEVEAGRRPRLKVTRDERRQAADRRFPSLPCRHAPYRPLLASVQEPGRFARIRREHDAWSCGRGAALRRAQWFLGLQAAWRVEETIYRAVVTRETWEAVKKRKARAANKLGRRIEHAAIWGAVEGTLFTSAPIGLPGETLLSSEQHDRDAVLADALRYCDSSEREPVSVAKKGAWLAAELVKSDDWIAVGDTDRELSDEEAAETLRDEAQVAGVRVSAEVSEEPERGVDGSFGGAREGAGALEIVALGDPQAVLDVLARSLGLEVSEGYLQRTGLRRPERQEWSEELGERPQGCPYAGPWATEPKEGA